MGIIDIIYNKKYLTFEALEKNIESLDTTTDKGDAMEYFSFFYLQYYSGLFNAENIYMEKDIPKNIKEKIKLESTDYGVDGIIQRKDGAITAYQVKFRSSRSGLTYKELATFYSEAEYADYRLVISNCNKLPQVSEKKKNHLSIMLEDFLNLDEEFFNSLYEFYKNNKKTIKKREPYKPRKYQNNIIDNIIKGFNDYDRGKLIAACGSGKTLMALWLQEEMNAQNIIYVVPSLALIKQTLESWLDNAKESFEFICVCSDKTVVEFEDEINVSSSEVSFPVTTSSDEVAKFLRKEYTKKIVFVTYNSIDVIVSATMKIEDFEFSLGIFDESHRTAGTKLSKMFVYGIHDKYINIDKRLFMTATERLVSPRIRKGAEEFGDIIFSMDDESLYGPVLDSLNFGEAIEKDIINDYKIVLVTIDEEEMNHFKKAKTVLKTEVGSEMKEVDKDVLLKQLILNKVIKELNVERQPFFRQIYSEQEYTF